MTRDKAEILKVARQLFRPGVLVGVVSTGDGQQERGHAFMVADPLTHVALAVRGASVQVFKLTASQITALRENGDLLSSLELGESRGLIV